MTFSIAARCARTNMFGLAVTTSAMAVGSRCPHARPGVGAVLTQHWTDPRLGPRGLALLAEGCDAEATLAAVVASTADAAWRQLAVIDASGRSAYYSGANVKPSLAGCSGRDCVAIGNILRNEGVPAAMVAAFEASPELPLATRLVQALVAGDAAGGEQRSLISASLLVVHEQSFPYVDLRVDADPAPLAALQLLWQEYEPFADQYVMRAVDPERVAANPPP
ncbi:MAG: DUF1028 domain-containing protein [Acidisphaera sp.]|nr:DUF1028 domain-containing protein [Acidisphaera sp.]